MKNKHGLKKGMLVAYGSRKMHPSWLNPTWYSPEERKLISKLLEGRKLPKDVAFGKSKIINSSVIDSMLSDGTI